MSAAAAASAASSSSSGSSDTFQLTPLYGCDAAHSAALCSVLRLGDLTILLDCGWDERYDESHLASLRAIIPSVDLVLITHPDLAHLGALPYAVGKLGLVAPIFATLPVWRMGQMFMYTAWMERWGSNAESASSSDASAPLFTLDDVDKAFDQMQQLKYSQTVRLQDKGLGIEVTPSCAGHMLGGAFWHLRKDAENIIYAVDFNHASERHLNGALLNAPQLHRPSALITDASNALVTGAKRSAQDAALTGAIAERLRAGGNVLLPVDAAGRVLELLLVIHSFWVAQSLSTSYTLAFLSAQSRNTIDFARSQLEWMTEKCRRMFDAQKINPFALGQVRLITNKDEMELLFAEAEATGGRAGRPFCLLASSATLETSLAQEALVRLAPDPRSLLLLTQRAPAWSVAGQLFSQDPKTPNSLLSRLPSHLSIARRSQVVLQGAELAAHLEEARLKREQRKLDRDDSDDDEDDAVDEEMDAAKIASAARRAMAAAGSLSIKRAQQSFPLFPYAEHKHSFDVWGETLTDEERRVITGQAAPLPSSSSGGAALSHSSMVFKPDLGGAMDDVPVSDGSDAPTKTVVTRVQTPLVCAVSYIDLEGRSDGRAIKTVIKDLQPRKLILLSGSADSKSSLRSHCLSTSIVSEVLLPIPNQSVSITSETALWRCGLKESFVAGLNFVRVQGGVQGAAGGEEYEVAYASGALSMHFTTASHLPLLGDEQATSSSGSNGTALSVSSRDSHPAIFLGGFKPADLQAALMLGGLSAEIVGDVVVCAGGLVNLRKVGPSRISIQGALCEEYFRIREILYDQYEIV